VRLDPQDVFVAAAQLPNSLENAHLDRQRAKPTPYGSRTMRVRKLLSLQKFCGLRNCIRSKMSPATQTLFFLPDLPHR